MIEVCPGADRFRTHAEGRTTWHSFSFGPHYDPGNVGFGSLVALNDERLPPGTGYPPHPHADLEIVSWVLSGTLRHASEVGDEVLPAGWVQRLSAGRGVSHAETAEGPDGARFLQAWLRPDQPGLAPSYACAEVPRHVGEWITVVAADGAGLLPIAVDGAALHAARLPAGRSLQLPDARMLHVFVTAGSVVLGERTLEAEDAARLTDEAGRRVTPPPGAGTAELLVWAFRG